MNNDYSPNEITKKNAIYQAEIADKLNIINSRNQILSIIVNILNSFLKIKQNSDTPLSAEVIHAFQNAIDNETYITDQILAELKSLTASILKDAATKPQISTPEEVDTLKTKTTEVGLSPNENK